MTTSFEALLPGTERALLHRVAVAQTEGRTPSFVGAVVRDGALVWSGSRSCVDGHAPDADTQFRIGSITKVFTAVLVMRLRDEGVLRLDDPLELHLEGTGAGEVTIAQLLGHSGGLAAETPGAWWERSSAALRPELSDVLGERPFLQAPGRRHHYSTPVTRCSVPGRGVARTALGGGAAARGPGTAGDGPYDGRSGGSARRWMGGAPLGRRDAARTVRGPRSDGAGGTALVDGGGPRPVRRVPRGGDERVLGAASVAEMRAPASAPGEGEWEELRPRAPAPPPGRPDPDRPHGLPAGLRRLPVGERGGRPRGDRPLQRHLGTAGGAVAADLVRIVAEAEPRLPEPWRPLPRRRPTRSCSP